MTHNFNYMTMQELRNARVNIGMTQSFAAGMLACSPWQLCSYETEQLTPPELLHIRYNILIDRASNGVLPYPKSKSHINAVRACMERRKRKSTPKKDVEKIHAVRLALNIKQGDLARAIEISASSLSNYENFTNYGLPAMPLSIYKKIVSVLREEKLKRIFGRNYRAKSQEVLS